MSAAGTAAQIAASAPAGFCRDPPADVTALRAKAGPLVRVEHRAPILVGVVRLGAVDEERPEEDRGSGRHLDGDHRRGVEAGLVDLVALEVELGLLEWQVDDAVTAGRTSSAPFSAVASSRATQAVTRRSGSSAGRFQYG